MADTTETQPCTHCAKLTRNVCSDCWDPFCGPECIEASDHAARCMASGMIGLRWESGSVFRGATGIDDGSVLPIPEDELVGLWEAMKATAGQSESVGTTEFEQFGWFYIKNPLLSFAPLHVRPGAFVVARHGKSTEKDTQKLYGKAIAAMKKGGWGKYQATAITMAVDLFKTVDTYGAAAFKCLSEHPGMSKIPQDYVKKVLEQFPGEAEGAFRGRPWPAETRASSKKSSTKKGKSSSPKLTAREAENRKLAEETLERKKKQETFIALAEAAKRTDAPALPARETQ